MRAPVFSLLFILFLLFSVLLPSAEASYQKVFCEGADTRRIERPLHPGKSRETFSYAFRTIPGTTPDLPLVIYLPGGPGGPSSFIGENYPAALALPRAFSVVLTDPRGIGCNEHVSETLTADGHGTEIWAADIIAVLEAVKPKSYILMGHSYGSVLATVVASKIESRGGLPPPAAVVLDGVLGRAFSHGEQYRGAIEAWEQLKKKLDPEVVRQLSGDPLPFSISARKWARFLVSGLTAGEGPGVPVANRLQFRLGLLKTGNAEERAKLEKDVWESAAHESNPAYLRIYVPMFCREISTHDNTDFTLFHGALVGFQDPEICHGFALEKPYDAAHWPVRAPIFYFQGEADPATELSQAWYHFRAQNSAHRFFVGIPEAGHSPLPSLADCEHLIWAAIVAKGAGLPRALEQCRWRTNFQEAPAFGAVSIQNIFF